jgi:serine/threonine protein kinase
MINKQGNEIFLIDFGISKNFRDKEGNHLGFVQNKGFVGTPRYASISAHQGNE